MAAARASPLERGKGSVTHFEAKVQEHKHPSSSPQGETCGMGDLGVGACELQSDNALGSAEKALLLSTLLSKNILFQNVADCLP